MLTPKRSPAVQLLEHRYALTGDFAGLAAQIAADVDLDGSVSLRDALEIVADLRQSGPRDAGELAVRRFDANADGKVSLADAMTVVARLREGGEGEWLGQREWLSDEQRENVRQLLSNLSELRLDSAISPDAIARLVTNLTSAIDGAGLPSDESVDVLLENLSIWLEDGELSPEETELLQDDLAVLLESAGVSPEAIERIEEDIDEIVATGIDTSDIETIVGDIRSIVAAFPGLSGERLDAIDELIAELHDLTEDALLGEEAIADLVDAFDAIADGATEPDYTLISQVIVDVRASRADGEIDDSERDTIAAGIDAVFESANIPQVERDALSDAFDGGFRGLFQDLLDWGRGLLDLFPIFRR